MALVAYFDLAQRVPNLQTPSHVPAASVWGTLQGGQTKRDGKAASEKMKLGKTGVPNSILCEDRFADEGHEVFFPLGINL